MSTNTDFRKSMNVSLAPKTMELITKKNKLSKRVQELNDIEERLKILRQHVGDGILTNSAKYISEDDKEEIRKIRNELTGEDVKKDDGYLKQIDKLSKEATKQKNILRKRISYVNKLLEQRGVDPGLSCSFYYNEEPEQ